MKEELDALKKNKTWNLVDLRQGKTPVGCKQVYKIKKFDRSIECYEACLVVKGFTHEYGIDYQETFALVACITTVRALNAVVAIRKRSLFQMDVKNAFLNGDFEKKVYMQPLPRPDHSSNNICKFWKALYRLIKQTPHAWFSKFSTTIHNLGFSSSPHDFALSLKSHINKSLSCYFMQMT